MDKEQIKIIISQLKKNSKIKRSKPILDSIQNIESRLNDNVFKLAVVGEFSSGKSTFINSIIGMDLLSHSTEETTATVTYINNVALNDERINTCKVNYKTGNSLVLKDLSQLSEYTTAQSNKNVANEILSVDIYINFLNVNYPIMIIDTPGLNGVADNHREITIEEIKKVHACIYLLPLKGISKTDIDYIYILRQYQNRFIFIQNFKDALNEFEGETPEFKVKQIESILQKEFFDNDILFNIGNPICLSALMALVSKDKRIKRLYSDSHLLNDEERELLYDKSGFIDFENTLIELIKSGEYKNTIISSALSALEQIISNVINELNDEKKEMKVLLESDSKKEQNFILQKRIDGYKENHENETKRLENFVLARKSDEFSLCKSFLKESTEDIISSIFQNVDKSLKYYEDISDFSSKHSKKSIGEFFALECNKEIKNLKNNLDSTVRVVLQQIYTLSILQAKKYTSKDVTNKQKQIDIQFSDAKFDTINLSFNSEKQKIKEKQKELINNQSKLKSTKDSESDNEVSLKNLENNLNIENDRHLQESKKIDNSIKALGNRPIRNVWYTTEKRTKTVYRGGLGILDSLFGPKYETVSYSVEHNNDDEIRRWEQKNGNLLSQKRSENERYCQNKRDNQRKIDELKRIKAHNEIQAQKIEKEIQKLNQEIQSDINDLEFLEKNAKRELLNNAKKELKDLIRTKCIEACSSLIEYLSRVFESNIPKIIDLTLEAYEKDISTKIKMFENIIKGNEKELYSIYSANDKELKELSSILKRIQDN